MNKVAADTRVLFVFSFYFKTYLFLIQIICHPFQNSEVKYDSSFYYRMIKKTVAMLDFGVYNSVKLLNQMLHKFNTFLIFLMRCESFRRYNFGRRTIFIRNQPFRNSF